MVWLPDNIKDKLGRYGLATLVFVSGLAMSAYAYVDHAKSTEVQQVSQLEDAARTYEFLLRRRLDQYTSANLALGAFFSASSAIHPAEFGAFVKASQMFSQLPGVGMFGYLPKVPAARLSAFEAESGLRFPGYRVSNRRDGAAAYFPLLYGQHAFGPARVDQLRGIDYSAIPDRWAAMHEAAALDQPVATAVQVALRDARQHRVVLVFSPVRKSVPLPGSTGQDRTLHGFVVSSIHVDSLFHDFDNGHLTKYFDLEVFDKTVSRENIVFDGDGQPHALEAKAAAALAHRAEVQFANRKWLIYFYVNKPYLPAAFSRQGAMLFAIGVLLTVIASLAAAAWSRRAAARRAMREFKDRFGGFFENYPFGVYALDHRRRFIQVNQRMASELGVGSESLIGTAAEQYIARDKRNKAARHFETVMAGKAVAYTTEITAADGRCSDLSIVLIPMRAGNKITHVLGFAENVTARKKAEKALYESRQMLQLILDNIPQSVFWKDIDSVYEGGNRSFLKDTGLPSLEHLIGKTDADLRWKDQTDHFRRMDLEVMQSGLAHMRTQATDVRKDGSSCWIETSKIALKDDAGEVIGILAVTEDITARKYMEQELFRRANHDHLTGLPNRAYFQSLLTEAVKRAQRRGGLVLMYFDIDRFKQINDTWGHDAGDEVIRMFAQRVRAAVRESDAVARLGGDEFVLIAEALQAPNDGALIAQKLVDAMGPAFELGTTRLQVSTSIGVAYFQTGMTPEMLVTAADQAMYAAKHAGRNCFRQAQSGPELNGANDTVI